MSVELYDHQIEALSKLKTGSILCGGVGSGKSRTALAYYYVRECGGGLCVNGKGSHRPMTKPKDLYIITTARKRDTLEWEQECVPFLLDMDHVVVDSWNNVKKYTEKTSSFFIFDEQRVVGKGAWVKAFLKITKQNNWILLSATPGDTWMDYIPVFIANGFYKNRTEFIRRHVVFNQYVKFPKVSKYVDSGRLIRLRKDILVNMRYDKPTKSHKETIPVTYNEDIYKIAVKDRWNVFTNRPVKDAAELFQLMRRIVNSDASRINAIKDLIFKHDRLIVFYNYNYELDILRELTSTIGVPTAEWNGHKHEPIPDTDKWVYLVQYTAGAEGWNCISTNVIVFYSQNYSYKVMVQSAGRIDRLNTPYSDLYYYHLRSDSPIDKAIFRSLKRKQNFNEKSFMETEKITWTNSEPSNVTQTTKQIEMEL